MASVALQILFHIISPCFGHSRKSNPKSIAKEQSPLLPPSTNTTTSTYQAISSREAISSTNVSCTKPSSAPKSTIPRILNVRPKADKSLVQAIGLDPERSSLILKTLSMRRDLKSYEDTAQTQQLVLETREKEVVKRLRGLSSKLRRPPERPSNERMIYSLQCAIQVLEEERQTLLQNREEIEREVALRREKLSLEQAKIDDILDTAFTTAKLMASRDEHTLVRPSSGEFEIDPFVFKEYESPLRTIIAERRKHFEKAKERLKFHVECFEAYRAMWREGNN
jgi:hypothetical protein